jgi:predicted NAD/FAD-dependent oxidoreductase
MMPYAITQRWDERWQILYPSGRAHSTHRYRYKAVHELRRHALAVGIYATEIQEQIEQRQWPAIREIPDQETTWRVNGSPGHRITPGQARLIAILRREPGQSLGHYAQARGVTRERIRQLMQTLQQRGITEQGPDGKWRLTEHEGSCATCGQPWTDGRINPAQCNPCRRNLGEWPTLNNGEQP